MSGLMSELKDVTASIYKETLTKGIYIVKIETIF